MNRNKINPDMRRGKCVFPLASSSSSSTEFSSFCTASKQHQHQEEDQLEGGERKMNGGGRNEANVANAVDGVGPEMEAK
jgi:hypothetical protein